MSGASPETIVEQRVAQLQAISTRRNELLRQMYYMMRRRNDAGPLLALDLMDDGGLHPFLQRFDITKDTETGSIANLSEAEFIVPGTSQAQNTLSSSSPTQDKNSMRRATRSQSRVTGLAKSPSPSLAKQPTTSTPFGVLNFSDQDTQTTTQGGDLEIDSDRNKFPAIYPTHAQAENHEQATPSHSPESRGHKQQPSFEPMFDNSKEKMVVESGQIDDEAMKVDADIVSEPSEENGMVSEDTFTQDQKHSNSLIEGGESDVLMREVSTEIVMDSSEAKPLKITNRQTPLPSLEALNVPIKSSIPSIPSGPSSPIQFSQTPRLPVILLAPSNSTESISFTFEGNFTPPKSQSSDLTIIQRHHFNPNYTLPPLKSLPAEFNKKPKAKKPKKEREKSDTKKDEWAPMGINRWAATLNANPVWKRIARASKCLSTREWGIAMAELKLIRAFDRIETLKDSGRWSFRQPKKQRGVGGLTKTHWDYLLDELKWMRIDFREERRWKMALAYHIASAVMEWHAAGSLEERINRGICISWKPSLVKMERDNQDNVPTDLPVVNPASETTSIEHQTGALLGVNYGSDEDEPEQQGEDPRNVVDALEPQSLLQDSLDAPIEQETLDEGECIKPKTEEVDDISALRINLEAAQTNTVMIGGDGDEVMAEVDETKVPGLKLNSSDPILGTKSSSNTSSNNGDADTLANASKSNAKQLYAPLREHILELDVEQLFLDLDDLHITPTQEPENGNDGIEFDLQPSNLSTLFPELQPLGLLDVPGPSLVIEGRKKSDKRSDRDDPNKRIEDTTYTKLFSVGQFMYTKPTLIGPLHPSKNWKDGNWLSMDDSPVYVEYEGPTRPPEDAMSEIFDNRVSNSTIMAQHQLLAAAARDKDRKRANEHQWSPNDDSLLKSLIDRFPYNWQLISESFNATRVTTPTDKRTARDCFERWREKWAPDVRRHQEAQQAAAVSGTEENVATSSTTQMTTRGVKRLASSMVSPSVSGSNGGEPKKRRRHILVQETVRKSVKKKAEFQQKMLANQRKPSVVHETHTPFNKMPYYSPAELSRMKAEKDVAKNTQDTIQLARRREELAKAAMAQQRLTPAQQQSIIQQQAALLQQQQQQQQAQQSGQQTPQPAQLPTQQATPSQSTAPQVSQQAQAASLLRQQNAILTNHSLGNIRGQVNISRINSPNVPAGASRLTPQQLLQFQQAQQQVRSGSQPTQAGANHVLQGQSQGQITVPSLNGNGSTLNGTHLASTFLNRDSTSSPAHVSPPRKSATPTNVNSPRVAPDQAQHGQHQMGVAQAAGNSLGRSNYFIQAAGLTQEQLNNVLRLQILPQQQNTPQQENTQPSNNFGP